MVQVLRRIALTFALMLLGLAASAGALGPVATDVDDFTFDSLDADYTLTRAEDGTSRLRVVETFVAVFPDADQNRGIRRLLPTSYNGQPLHPQLVSVTDENGAARPVETEDDGDAFSITSRSDSYLRGEQTFVITYDLENVTWTFEGGGQEFYWDVNGVDWAQPFGEVTARVHIDAALAADLTGRQACYAGEQDTTDPCPITATEEPDGAVTVAAEAVGLGPHETMTIAVGFAPDTFVLFDSSYLASGWGWAQSASALVLAGAVGGAVWTRRRFLRDAPGRSTIIAEYTPPPGVDALESAVMLGKTSKAIPAEVLEQAIVGSIRILEGSKRVFGGTRLQVELIDPSRADRDGRMLLDGLFGKGAQPGAIYEFGKQDTRLSRVASKILKEAGEELESRGVRRSVPARVRTWPAVALFVATVLVIVFGGLALSASVNEAVPLVLMVAAGIALAVGLGMVFHRPLTDAGAELRDHLAGLKVFIDWAEKDRIRMLQSPQGAERRPVDVNDPRQMIHLYETLLPYAVVFGQEKKWADELMVYYGDAGYTPSWYYGAAAFNAAAFSSSIASLSSAAMSSSSTTGGSTGGGSAGGGGGGGGGGGV
ncbi:MULTISPECIES: DUF2207 domain-containing protein [Microbacterium]|uniref:DUF2207 domain-containing protein n=1 Tax=Microbacterium TaxID=33882 RepID=UPI00214B5ABC|nr:MULTISPECIES: DUF2207 domain-containing protein [unclassified Microbacterium]MCR2812442.1 DUF2207 domain-containing protein [Microbacterium sp. zg.Y1084]MDL5485599.1 DUF2207 domain-containing protein [Microbacterium sp. zg-Y1211]